MFPGSFGAPSRRASSVLGIAMMAGFLSVGGLRPAAAAPGDLNSDELVDLSDAVIALEIASGITAADGLTSVDGDVAGGPDNTPDGQVGLADAVRIARAANGLDDLGGGSGGEAALPKMDSVTFTEDFAKSYKLDPAYRVQGTVTDTNGQSISFIEVIGQVTRTTSGQISFDHITNLLASDSYDVETGMMDFTVLLDKGLNNVSIVTQVSEFDAESGDFSSYTVAQDAVPATLNMTGSVTGVTFVRPDIPAPGTLTGTVGGSNFTPTFVAFSSEGGGFVSATLTGATYTLQSGPGSGTLYVFGNLMDDTSVSTQAILGATPITVNSGATTTHDVAIPTLATITGSVTAPDGVEASSASISSFPVAQDAFSSNNGLSGTDQEYKLAVPPGTYNLSISLPQEQFGEASLNLTYTQEITIAEGANTRDVALPAIPANVTFTGTVTGPDNAPLSGASVSAIGPVANGYTAAAFTQTAADGAFSLTLPPGTYTVDIHP